MTKTITYDAYLRLTGLLALAADHRKMMDVIERSACAITGDEPQAGCHTSDAIWCGGSSPQRLLSLLDIAVPTATTTPEAASHQAASAMKIANQFGEQFGPEGQKL